MDLTNDELDLILAGLFELTITYVEDDERCAKIDALAERLGGDPSALFFGVDLAARGRLCVRYGSQSWTTRVWAASRSRALTSSAWERQARHYSYPSLRSSCRRSLGWRSIGSTAVS